MKTKFEILVETSQKLFHKYGIKKVTIEEICKEAGVSKMTFYKHFGNKNELVKHIINHLYDDGFAKYQSLMAKNIPFNEKIMGILDLKERLSKGVSMEFVNDLMKPENEELGKIFQGKVQRTMGALMHDLSEAQKRGEINKRIKPELMLHMLNYMMSITEDQQLIDQYESTSQLAIEVTEFFFYGIMDHKK